MGPQAVIPIKATTDRQSLSDFFLSTDKRVTLTLSYRVSLALRDTIRSGRGIRRLVTLYGSIQQLVKENDQRLLGPGDSDDEEENLEAPQPPEDPQERAQR